MPSGKLPEYDRDKIMDYVCDALATSSRGLGNIIKQGEEELKSYPTYSTIMLWLSEDEALSERYARAKEAQADFMADEMIDIADDGRNDWMKRQQGNGETVDVLNNEVIQRSKIRIDTRKWLASKLKPKKYSEKLQTEHSGPDGGPIKTNSTINFIPVSSKPKDK